MIDFIKCPILCKKKICFECLDTKCLPSIKMTNISLSMRIVVNNTMTEKMKVHIGSAILYSG